MSPIASRAATSAAPSDAAASDPARTRRPRARQEAGGHGQRRRHRNGRDDGRDRVAPQRLVRRSPRGYHHAEGKPCRPSAHRLSDRDLIFELGQRRRRDELPGDQILDRGEGPLAS